MSSSDVSHFGGCHCGAVRWKFSGPEILEGIKCNCSICWKKQNHHCIIKLDRKTCQCQLTINPSTNTKKLTRAISNDDQKLIIDWGSDNISTYQFNSGVAQHKFCSTCGVQSFYHPRSNPDAVAIMPHCIDSPTVKSINWSFFNGQEWEKTMIDQAPIAQ